MLIPTSYFFPDLGDPAGPVKSRGRGDTLLPDIDGENTARPILGLDRGIVSLAGLFAGIVAYGGLMELIL